MNLRIVGRDNVPAGITCGFRQEQAPALQHWVLLYIARVSNGTMWASSPTDFLVQSINKIILDIFPEGIFGFIAAAVGKAEQGTAIIQNQICLKIYLVALQDTSKTLPKIFRNAGRSKPLPYIIGYLFYGRSKPPPYIIGYLFYGRSKPLPYNLGYLFLWQGCHIVGAIHESPICQ